MLKALPAALVVAALVVAVAWGVRPDQDRPSQHSGARPSAATTTASATPTRDESTQRRIDVAALLDARSRAVLRRDKKAFLAGVDPSAKTFRGRQATMFDRIAKIPLADWSYDVAGSARAPEGGAALPAGSWSARVILHYTYAGQDSAVDSEENFTFAPHGGSWLLVDDDKGGQKDVWDIGPVNVVRTRSSLVLGATRASSLRRYARDVDRAVVDVGKIWTKRWSRRVVVVVPQTQKDMAALLGDDGKGLSQIAAVTTGYAVAGPSRGNYVVVNPAAYRTLGDLGRHVVMTHEVTHVATRALSFGPVPIWMSEGFADYVAYRAVRLPTRVVAQDVLRKVRAGHAPSQLPVEADFDQTKGDLSPAYEGAWLACRMISERYGEKRLIALYVALGDRAVGLPEKDIKAVLGISEEKLVRDWRAYLKTQARR